MLKKIKRYFQMRRAQKRMYELGLIIDTIDIAFVAKGISTDARMDFWWRFISDQEYRKKFLEDMMKVNQK